MQRRQQSGFGTRSIMGIVFLVLAVMAIIFIAKSIFTILSWLMPVLIIATLIIDHKVILDYGKWIGGLLKNNLLYGIGAVLFTFFASPVVAVYLFGKAMFKRQVRKMRTTVEERQRGTTTEYEEVEEDDFEFELKDEEEVIPLEIPKTSTRRLRKEDDRNSYDDLFNDI